LKIYNSFTLGIDLKTKVDITTSNFKREFGQFLKTCLKTKTSSFKKQVKTSQHWFI
jgi:hypothetical protein